MDSGFAALIFCRKGKACCSGEKSKKKTCFLKEKTHVKNERIWLTAEAANESRV